MGQWQWFPDTWVAVALGGMEKETKTPEPREPGVCEPRKEVCFLFWRRGAILWRSCREGSCGSEGWTSNPTPSQRSGFNYFIISFTKTGTREKENKPQKLTLGSSQATEPQTTTLKSVCYWTGDSRTEKHWHIEWAHWLSCWVGDLGTFASSLLRNTLSLPKSTAVISFAH